MKQSENSGKINLNDNRPPSSGTQGAAGALPQSSKAGQNSKWSINI